MKHLFHEEFESINAEGYKLSDEVELRLKDVMDIYQAGGYSMRDVESVIMSTVDYMVAERVLRSAIKLRKEQRSL
jgi:hypothetical protein